MATPFRVLTLSPTPTVSVSLPLPSSSSSLLPEGLPPRFSWYKAGRANSPISQNNLDASSSLQKAYVQNLVDISRGAFVISNKFHLFFDGVSVQPAIAIELQQVLFPFFLFTVRPFSVIVAALRLLPSPSSLFFGQ